MKSDDVFTPDKSPLQQILEGKGPSLKKPQDVPGLSAWSMFAGGIGGAYGKHSYQHNTKHGEYHMSPLTNSNGMHAGHHLMFCHNGRERSKKIQSNGLWHDLGIHNHPAKAVSAARKHHNEITG